MGGKRATTQQIDNFRVDAKLLRQKYLNIEMAEKMNEDPSWLSGCIKGSKTPGKGLIDTFYKVFSQDLLDNPNTKETEPAFGHSVERGDEIQRLTQTNQLLTQRDELLTQNIVDLRNHVGQFGVDAETFRTMATYTAKLVDAQVDLITMLKRAQAPPPASNEGKTGE